MYRVSFTGYRPSKLPFFGEDDAMCIELKRRLVAVIEKLADDGAQEFYSGMALGVDTWCAEAVLELRRRRRDIRLIAILPCREQDAKWSEPDRSRYNDILSRCDKVICISSEYTKDCMHRRNRALVDICDVLVAVYDGQSGGTRYTVDYAAKKGRRIVTVELM